jgi:hypothetical protein
MREEITDIQFNETYSEMLISIALCSYVRTLSVIAVGRNERSPRRMEMWAVGRPNIGRASASASLLAPDTRRPGGMQWLHRVDEIARGVAKGAR